jgi:hypothetical protein
MFKRRTYCITAANGLAMLLTGAILAGCGKTLEMSSTWRVPGVTADSSAREWKTPFAEVGDTKVFIGIQNDSSFLYVRLIAPGDQFRRQVMLPGLTVSFTTDGGRKLGIVYPTGGLSQQELEILGPGKDDRVLLSSLDAPGIKVQTRTYEGSATYELIVPLAVTKDHPYALGVSPGATVEVMCESGKEKREEMGGGSGEGRGRIPGGGGGYGGGRRGGGGFGGGRGGGGMQRGGSRVEPLDFKATLHISVPQTGTSPK